MEGRYICVYCKIFGALYVLTLYIPPPYKCSIFKKVMVFFAKYSTVPGIIMGDFNTIVQPHWDRVQTEVVPLEQTTTPFGRMLGELGVFDVWCLNHPGERQYSCHSSSFQSLSRIN